MSPWRVYQQVARAIDIPLETMHLVNVLADGGYLVKKQPPYLNYDLPEFGTKVSWLDEYPTKGIKFCKATYGADAGVAAAIRAVGTEVLDHTKEELETSFTILGRHISHFLQDISSADIADEIQRVQSYFEKHTMELITIKEAHYEERESYRYCDHCGSELDPAFVYRCPDCGMRFPGWSGLVYAEGEEQSNSKWREQLDVTVETQHTDKQLLILEATSSLPGWIEEGGKIGQIINNGVADMGRIVNTEGRRIQVDYWGGIARSLTEQQEITVCSAESMIATTQQMGLLLELREEFAGWQANIEDDPTVAKIAANGQQLINTLDQSSLSKGVKKEPHVTETLGGAELDESQLAVVSRILGLEEGELSIVVGPPGSGKTEVIAKAAAELTARNDSVLVTSHTNIAVDNVIEKLHHNSPHQLIRAGRPEKMSKGSSEVMLSKVIETSDDEDVTELLERVNSLKAEISTLGDQLQHDHPQYEMIQKAGETGPVSTKHQTEINENIDSKQAKLAKVRRQIKELQSEAEALSIENANITGATIIRAQLGGLAQVEFDTVIIDEASQIPVPLGLLGMINAKKWVVVGDHNQLQPVIRTISTDDGSPPDDASIFSFLRNRYDIDQWLKTHYRSHEDIIGFSQEEIYDGQITIDESCPDDLLWDLQGKSPSRAASVFDGPPVTFVDVDGEESWRRRFSGTVNTSEVDVVGELVAHFVDKENINESNLGVITPYRGQRTLIDDEITDYGGVEVSTVDGFQGRERDIIIFSTVNSEKGGMRFAGNENRFNVACTRAKTQFIMIGNRDAIEEKAPDWNTFRSFIKYATITGGVFSWKDVEWMNKEFITGNQIHSQLKTRVADIIALAPTSSEELADEWGLQREEDARIYLNDKLDEYYKRDENNRIHATIQGEALTST